jgi:aspartate carbamoyltransferase regulatory subunit
MFSGDYMAEDFAQVWREDLFEFAWIPAINEQLVELSEIAEHEDWTYRYTPSEHAHPVLYSYFRRTYGRVAQESKIGLSENALFACFNTGLVTSNQEPIYASFESNRKEGAQPWYFKGWFRRGEWELNKFPELPDLPHYFDDPTCLVLDTRKDFRVNIEHIIADTPRERFPEPYRSMSDFALQTVLQGAINNAKERVRRSYKTAIPQHYRGQVQLLPPLCLSNPQQADLALVVERHNTFYRCATCLTLDMAYNNARQIARPDRDWLQP